MIRSAVNSRSCVPTSYLHRRITRVLRNSIAIQWLATIGFFLGLTILATWPVAQDISHQFAGGGVDPPYTMWTMAWQAHAWESDLENYFNANIFHPEQGTLAYAPLNLAPMLLEFPIWRATGNPILAYNFDYLVSWALIGFGAFLLARKMGLGFAGSLVTGILAEISPFSYNQIGHLEILWIGWTPFFFVAASTLLQRGRKRDYFLTLIFFLLQSLATWYFALYLSLTTFAWMLYLARRQGRHKMQHWLSLALVMATAWLMMLPFLLPYLNLEKGYERIRTQDQAEHYAARLDSYLKEPATNRTWRAVLGTSDLGEVNFFPGFVCLALATLGAKKIWKQDSQGRFLILLGVTSFVLTFGPTVRIDGQTILPLPEALLRLLPGYSLTRVPSRWIAFSVFALALCAGAYAQRLASQRRHILLALMALALVENFSIPLPIFRLPLWENLGSEYRWLATQPRQVVVELPMPSEQKYLEMRVGYMYRSIFHWQPVINGYGDYIPEWYESVVKSSFRFPLEDSLRTMSHQGVQLIVLHTDLLPSDQYLWIKSELDSETARAWLKPIATYENAVIFRLNPKSE